MFLRTSLFEAKVLTFASIKSEGTGNFSVFQVHCEAVLLSEQMWDLNKWINGTKVFLCISD